MTDSNGVTLVILFNHYYTNKFDEIFFLMPFYSGDKENVIPVYGNSFFFGTYIAQAERVLTQRSKSDFYLFIADDLFLNPQINQENFREYFGLQNSYAYIPQMRQVNDMDDYWSHSRNAKNWKPSTKGIEIPKDLLLQLEFDDSIKSTGSPANSIRRSTLYPKLSLHFIQMHSSNMKYLLKYFAAVLLNLVFVILGKNQFSTYIPMFRSYSDIFVVPRSIFPKFSRLIGAFSSTDLFVEIAIPTALALTCENIVTDKDLDISGQAFWPDHKGEYPDLHIYNRDFSKLIQYFPANQLYIHPVKLSQWRIP
jgi:hypothetical protein